MRKKKYTYESVLEFVRKLKELPESERDEACYKGYEEGLFDWDTLSSVCCLPEAPCYLPGFFDMFPSIDTRYSVRQKNIWNRAHGFPEVHAF